MKENINEHDMTKRMMDVIRGGYKSKLITEDEQPNDPNNPSGFNPDKDVYNDNSSNTATEQKDVIELKQGDAAFNDELKKMRDSVDGSVVITSFNIYPTDRNVVIDGFMEKQEGENTGVFFKMAVTSSDIEINMVDIEYDDEVNQEIQHLKGYYSTFKKEWKGRVNDEYQNSNNV